jgi:quinolinate synthase
MKRNTLANILRSLETLEDEVLVDEAVRVRALAAVERMIAVA